MNQSAQMPVRSMRFAPELDTRIRQFAQRESRSYSNAIRRLIEYGLTYSDQLKADRRIPPDHPHG